MSAEEVKSKIKADAKSAYLGLDSISEIIRVTAQGYEKKLNEQKRQLDEIMALMAARRSEIKIITARGAELYRLYLSYQPVQNQCVAEVAQLENSIASEIEQVEKLENQIAQCQNSTAAAISAINAAAVSAGARSKAVVEAQLKACVVDYRALGDRRKKLADFQALA
jgi:chromosome segregation ATPase